MLGIIYNKLTHKKSSNNKKSSNLLHGASLADNNGSLGHTSHCTSSSTEGMAVYSDRNRLYSRNRFASIPGMDLVFCFCFCFCFCFYLQGLNQPIVSGLTKSVSISRGSYISRVPTIQQRSHRTATMIMGSMGCINAEITRSFTS